MLFFMIIDLLEINLFFIKLEEIEIKFGNIILFGYF